MRAQTRNLVELLGLARHRGTYYMFMEDDFRRVSGSRVKCDVTVAFSEQLCIIWEAVYVQASTKSMPNPKMGLDVDSALCRYLALWSSQEAGLHVLSTVCVISQGVPVYAARAALCAGKGAHAAAVLAGDPAVVWHERCAAAGKLAADTVCPISTSHCLRPSSFCQQLSGLQFGSLTLRMACCQGSCCGFAHPSITCKSSC